MPDIKPQVYKLATRHLVSIFMAYADDGEPDVASGFILDLKGAWYLVTAGHVIGGFDRAFEKGRIRKCRLIDGLATDAKWRHTIPLDYGSTVRFNIGNEDDIDYGLIRLDALTVDSLKANNIVALSEDRWKEPPGDIAQYMLIGTPGQLVRMNLKSDGEPMLTGAMPIIMDILPTMNPPEELVRASPRFYGQVPGTVDIGGMSGAPLLGLQRTNPFHYWAVGVQSGWHKPNRILAACPFKLLIELATAKGKL